VIRHSFRIGLTLGLLAGLVVALAKILRSNPHEQPQLASGAPWPKLATDPAVPAAPTTRLRTEPAAPAGPQQERPVVEPDVLPIAPTEQPAGSPAQAEKVPKAAGKRSAGSPTKKATKKRAPVTAWVEPSGEVCPTSHPVKAKLTSKIFHLPGMLNYERTRPDRCYRDAAAAEGDGLRAAKR
jgi:hypothetical protein